MVTQDINADLARTKGAERDENIATDLAAAELEEILEHFLLYQSPWRRDGKTWSMVQLEREVRSQMYCILGTYHCLFMNASVCEYRTNSDRYMILR